MKRSPIVLLGTVAGVAGVLLLNPSGETLVATAATEADSGATTATSGATAATETTQTTTQTTTTAATPTPSATASTTTASTAGVSGTATGDAVFVRYGNVQLTVTVKDGVITDIAEEQMPNQDGRSMMISQQAGPMLKSQALKAQSANINGISGATYTSVGYQKSLQSALDQLGF